MWYQVRRFITKIKRILQNLDNFKYLKFHNQISGDGILLVIHESQKLGASILTLHIAEELNKLGINTYIVSRQFGVMNNEYSKVTHTQIALTKNKYKKICKKLHNNYYYKKALLITACNGDLTNITKKSGFTVVSMIHELDEVIKLLHIEKETKEMLQYSDRILFSTSIAKNQILNLLEVEDSQKIFVKPQGTYFAKPLKSEIDNICISFFRKYPNLKNKKIILGIGNTTYRKGFDIFVDLASKLTDFIFVWAGKEERYYNQTLKLHNNRWPKNFIYLGCLNNLELSAVYSISNLYLMCSRFDTLPSTIMEALLFGKPVLGAKNSGGIIDVITNENGYLVENCTVEEFIQGINYIFMHTYKIENINFSFKNYVMYVASLFEER